MEEQLSLGLTFAPETLVQLWTPDEIYDALDEESIPNFAENRRIERKGPAVQPKAMAEYLSMWSNTQPHGGLILVGVENDGTISGCRSMSEAQKNAIESLSPLCQDARWACKEVAVKNSKGEQDFILAFRVTYRADKLVETSSGKAFIREGDNKFEINEALRRELRIAKGEIHYELEEVALRYPADFDTKDIEKFCAAFFANRRYREDKGREELLELAKLGKRSGAKFTPNLACALLFAKDPRDVIPGARIRIIRYEGTMEKFGSEMNSVFSTFVDGNISKILYEAKPIISSQLRSFQRFTESGRITVQQEYPEEAWFEALVNAVAHRSYNFKTQNIFVKIFDDRFVVESPGGFIPPTTAETVYDAHNPRNPYLMEAMMHLELTFCGFEGTRRMRRAMQTAKLPEPRFKQIEALAHQVHVMLENDIASRKAYIERDLASVISEDQYRSMSDDERKIVSYLIHAQQINITTATLVTGKSWPTTSKTIAGLVDSGVLILAKGGRRRDSTKTYRLHVPG